VPSIYPGAFRGIEVLIRKGPFRSHPRRLLYF